MNRAPESGAPSPLQALWLQRMRHDLPAAAAARPDWPVRLDHCFGRVILDAVCGVPWREAVAPPAWRHLDAGRLGRAVALADAILAGEADLAALNRASLALRRRARGDRAGAPPRGGRRRVPADEAFGQQMRARPVGRPPQGTDAGRGSPPRNLYGED